MNLLTKYFEEKGYEIHNKNWMYRKPLKPGYEDGKTVIDVVILSKTSLFRSNPDLLISTKNGSAEYFMMDLEHDHSNKTINDRIEYYMSKYGSILKRCDSLKGNVSKDEERINIVGPQKEKNFKIRGREVLAGFNPIKNFDSIFYEGLENSEPYLEARILCDGTWNLNKREIIKRPEEWK